MSILVLGGAGYIGLIEVIGLAVLPARLKAELAAVADALVTGTDLRANELTENTPTGRKASRPTIPSPGRTLWTSWRRRPVWYSRKS